MSTITKTQIQDFFVGILGREATSEDIDHHLGIARQGEFTLRHLAQSLMRSSEAFLKNEYRKDELYRNLVEIPYRDINFLLPRNDFSSLSLGSEGYEPYVSNHLFPRLRRDDVFLDIGANLGLFALPASKVVGDSGHVLAFEAASDNAKLLALNAQNNKINNITIYPFGLGDFSGSAFSPNGGKTSNRALLSGNPPYIDENIDIMPITTADLILQGVSKIDVMKIDVEGFEYRVFIGAERVINRTRPRIYMEYSSEMQQRSSLVVGQALLRMLGSWGYEFTILHRNAAAEGLEDLSFETALSRIEQELESQVAKGGSHLDLYLHPRN